MSQAVTEKDHGALSKRFPFCCLFSVNLKCLNFSVLRKLSDAAYSATYLL